MNPGEHSAYRATIRALSDRLVATQRPIRILDATQWDPTVREAFMAAGCRTQPPVDEGYYARRPLGFDPEEKRREFQELERDINRQLGQFSSVGAIMRRMCREYETVVRMLEARGRPEFCRLSQELYGSAADVFHAGEPTLGDFGVMMSESLTNIDRSAVLEVEERSIGAEEATGIVQAALDRAFQDPEHRVRVILSDGIVADAAAGSDYLKIRREARFNARDLRILEVHEGWVHLGTTLNGLSQPVCTFLSKGPPSSTVTQEGLAILIEIMAFASYPARLWRITNRIRGIAMAENGATFLEVFQFFRDQGLDEEESYTSAVRLFRGSLPTLGPFTKDISYSKGFVLTYNFVQLAVRRGLLDRIPLLFCGKTTLEDVRDLQHLVEEGIVVPPRYLPPMVMDLNALTAWMCFSNFLNHLDLERIAADYASVL